MRPFCRQLAASNCGNNAALTVAHRRAVAAPSNSSILDWGLEVASEDSALLNKLTKWVVQRGQSLLARATPAPRTDRTIGSLERHDDRFAAIAVYILTVHVGQLAAAIKQVVGTAHK